MEREVNKLKYVYEILTPKIRSAVMAVPDMEKSKIQEIRIRLNKKLSVTIFSKEYFVSYDGRLMSNPGDSVQIENEDIDYVYQHAFQNSLHSFQREITRGYITIDGGSRVGFCGTAVLNSNKNFCVENVKNISSINIRVAREIIGCATDIYSRVFSDGLKSLLIAGPPSSGKTTVLRDLTRIIGEHNRISLIDERNEISATVRGVSQNFVGAMTDVFNSYNKYEGIMTAVKVMSPVILVCDEIGSREDYEALEYCLNSGVKLIASCHAASFEEVKKKQTISRLRKSKAFDYCAVLGIGSMCGKITSLSKIGGKND